MSGGAAASVVLHSKTYMFLGRCSNRLGLGEAAAAAAVEEVAVQEEEEEEEQE